MTEFDKLKIHELELEVKQLKAQLEKPVSKKKVNSWTEEELYNLTRKQQTSLIRKLGGEITIPRYEKDRVNLILELSEVK